ncbi:glutaminyl-peptide cyclotransferase [Melampsora larici-populina 98AG31]|uniref:Peptide hydrolase n=1 Tax=Melampsora larici-populina (strain 98AG31 / pathotype 3-4-7) TaxID=747676 RepID=F4R8F4_MELLP|nr:glutaminyl-peptide cyclotransferase [Melampsora larici-populina 98AG31]EGG11615.1 glutaminyl-peptide cyclotransferase [Melampsora larici-populina 98AG31]
MTIEVIVLEMYFSTGVGSPDDSDSRERSEIQLDFKNPNSLLSKILIPRPVESQNLQSCRTLFESHFQSLSKTFQVPKQAQLFHNFKPPPIFQPIQVLNLTTWKYESHTFQDITPYGTKTFTNQIFTHDPTAPLRLILAAHIDSKYFPPGDPSEGFVGATDSAAPVAIILQIVKSISPLLDFQLEQFLNSADQIGQLKERITLQVVLFDGEEAFKDWTHTDSIYGARALAKKWAEPIRTPNALQKQTNQLDNIQAFVLFDLLGARSPSIHNFFEHQTGWMYEAWQEAELRLSKLGVISLTDIKTDSFFKDQVGSNQVRFFGGVEDDHIPFLAAKVPILHLISAPFPSVWHEITDNVNALDYSTILNWVKIGEVALIEYFGLQDFLESNLIKRHDELNGDVGLQTSKTQMRMSLSWIRLRKLGMIGNKKPLKV